MIHLDRNSRLISTHGRGRATRRVFTYALGGMEASIDGVVVRRWGGRHAGTLQARALFAMLFDNGRRGVTKDDVIDVIWPGTDLSKADVAFHRTLLGLRRALATAGLDSPVQFRDETYYLSAAYAMNSDVASFEHLVTESAASASVDERLDRLESAIALYRGDYLDGCPYYGDSAAVEDRRTALRELYQATLREVAAIHESRGTFALAALRRAQSRWHSAAGAREAG